MGTVAGLGKKTIFVIAMTSSGCGILVKKE